MEYRGIYGPGRSPEGKGRLVLGPIDLDTHFQDLRRLVRHPRYPWVIDDSWALEVDETIKASVRAPNSLWWAGYDGSEVYGFMHLNQIEYGRNCFINGYAEPGHPRRAIHFIGLACRFAFEMLDVHRVSAEFARPNQGIEYLLLKNGFQDEAILQGFRWYRHMGLKDPVDTKVMRLFRREWEALHG